MGDGNRALRQRADVRHENPVPGQPARPRPRPRPRPNVVVIVLDDMGFAELGCYGSSIRTPNIDRLAANGIRYNNFNVTPLCSPTRACLMTGRNHHAVGMGFLADFPMTHPGYTCKIADTANTLPSRLRHAGYSTFSVGKWHLTPPAEQTAAGPFDRWPLGLGFDRYYGSHHNGDQWAPDLVCDNGFIDPPSSPTDGYHLTEDLASRAIELIQDQQQAAPWKPFFLYFAPSAMHGPHQVPSSWSHAYQDHFDRGWDVIRQEYFERQVKMGIVPKGTTATGRPTWVRPWDDIAPDERRVLLRQMEVYAGFLSHTDAQIGRIVDFISRIGIIDNTIIFLMSDNGADGGGGPSGRIRDAQEAELEYMIDHIDDIGGFRSKGYYASGWAWMGNTPFWLWKSYSWLGGVRVPLIAHWPNGIPESNRAQVSGAFCHAIDIMPTILDLVDAAHDGGQPGVMERPTIDGSSFRHTFTEPEHQTGKTQYFEMLGSRSIYDDGWKATTNHVAWGRGLITGSDAFDTDRWSLFYLPDDFAETNDLAEAQPEQLAKMINLWWHEAGKNQVLPLVDTVTERVSTVENPTMSRYRYLPGGRPIATPSLVNGFRITADFELSEGDDHPAGVILAQGDWNFGWACYMLDGNLAAVFSFDDPPCAITAGQLWLGRHQIEISYFRKEETCRAVKVVLDGTAIGEQILTTDPSRVDLLMSLLRPKLTVGRGRGIPATDDYMPPFPFNGRIDQVVLEPTIAS